MKLLMVEPEYFSVKYSINPFMSQGAELKKVDIPLAQEQWRELKCAFESCGAVVQTLAGHPELPDMVFAANHGLVYKNLVILGKMAYEERSPEVDLFKTWYEKNGFEIFESSQWNIEKFEGPGDALFNYDQSVLFAGYGVRTDIKVYDHIEEFLPGVKILRVKNNSPLYYHLDTSLTVLGPYTVGLVRSAFTEKDFDLISSEFSNIIVIDEEEAQQGMAGNAFCPNGQDVVVQRGNAKFCYDLKSHGLNPIEVETGEFIKAGGSVFCLKNVVDHSV